MTVDWAVIVVSVTVLIKSVFDYLAFRSVSARLETLERRNSS